MDRLADEILQLVFNELQHPAAFAALSKRYHAFSQDSYVRARYFLANYGSIQALFFALGRPSVLTERVLDILLSSGAHISRYLVQLAVHHYFRTPVPFIKHPWVKLLPLPVFSHFLKLATIHLGDFSTSKGEDDGSVFCLFVKESRMPAGSRTITSDTIAEMLEIYKFMPFCDKDPIMAQFPLALAIEPRFLPLAVANGFRMDSSYRDYVFRRMFERSSSNSAESHTRKVLHNVRELCRLDSSMFVSRTVAAEVCMEAQANPAAYSALKSLDRAHELRFELSALVHDLIKNFVSTRSVTAESSAVAVQYLYRDFLGCTSADPTVRLVLLLSVFAALLYSPSANAAHLKLQSLKLTPLTHDDLVNMLLNPFVETFSVVGSYATAFMGYSSADLQELLAGVAVDCLPLSSKGNMLKAIVKRFPETEIAISDAIFKMYRLTPDALPAPDDETACVDFYSRLCGDLYTIRKNALVARRTERPVQQVEAGAQAKDGAPAGPAVVVASEAPPQEDAEMAEGGGAEDASVEAEAQAVVPASSDDQPSNLGRISQLTLSAAIRNDDLNASRRRRFSSYVSHYTDYTSLLPYPADAVHSARWAATHFGVRHAVTAELMKHVVVNQPSSLCSTFIFNMKVPITLLHFKLLARLGRSPPFAMFTVIEEGAKFYESEADYLDPFMPKIELDQDRVQVQEPLVASSSHAPTRRKRPRRSAASSVKSYAILGSSDDEDARARKAPRPVESEMAKWMRHLSVLHRDELRKFNERKKRAEREVGTTERPRVHKSDFLRLLGPRLRDWRRREEERLAKLAAQGMCVAGEDAVSGDEDDGGEYVASTSARRSAKRRRTASVAALLDPTAA